MFLITKATESKDYNTNSQEQMSGPFLDKFWNTVYAEIDTLDKICAWDVIDGTDDMNVIDSKCFYTLKCIQ